MPVYSYGAGCEHVECMLGDGPCFFVGKLLFYVDDDSICFLF